MGCILKIKINQWDCSSLHILLTDVYLTCNWFPFPDFCGSCHHHMIDWNWLDLSSPRHMPLLGYARTTLMLWHRGEIVQFKALKTFKEANNMGTVAI